MIVFLWILGYLFTGFLLSALSSRLWDTRGLMVLCCMVAMPLYLLIILWCIISGKGKPHPFLYMVDDTPGRVRDA